MSEIDPVMRASLAGRARQLYRRGLVIYLVLLGWALWISYVWGSWTVLLFPMLFVVAYSVVVNRRTWKSLRLSPYEAMVERLAADGIHASLMPSGKSAGEMTRRQAVVIEQVLRSEAASMGAEGECVVDVSKDGELNGVDSGVERDDG